MVTPSHNPSVSRLQQNIFTYVDQNNHLNQIKAKAYDQNEYNRPGILKTISMLFFATPRPSKELQELKNAYENLKRLEDNVLIAIRTIAKSKTPNEQARSTITSYQHQISSIQEQIDLLKQEKKSVLARN